jgi:hypothetical protein
MSAIAPIQNQIAEAKARVADLIRRSEDMLIARRPIDFSLDAEIMDAELELIHLEQMAAMGAATGDDQPAFKPEDLDLPMAA